MFTLDTIQKKWFPNKLNTSTNQKKISTILVINGTQYDTYKTQTILSVF